VGDRGGGKGLPADPDFRHQTVREDRGGHAPGEGPHGVYLKGFVPFANAILEKYDFDPERVVWIEYFLTWNLRNLSGETVASGLYPYRLEADGKVWTGKVAVLR
jgi:hypothetical protein